MSEARWRLFWSNWFAGNLLEARMNKLFVHFAKNESGATAIEYGLIASLISVAIIGALTTLGSKVTVTFGKVSAQLK
jgi:pilus assembly protein Flp/PilA